MSRRGIVNTLVALIAILTTSGFAAVAVIDGPPASAKPDLFAVDAAGRGSFAIDSPETTADTRPTASTQPGPTTRTPAAQAPVTTLPPPPPTTVPPVTDAPTPPPPGMPVTGWPPTPPPPPPVVIQTGPSSWKFEDKGITVTAAVSPAAPRVGDTITISFTTGGDGEFCCRAFVFADGLTMIGHSQRGEGEPCPPSAVTSGTASVVVSEPGPFTFDVQATRAPAECVGPHIFANVGLSVTLEVLAA